jgi:hypothetical protein
MQSTSQEVRSTSQRLGTAGTTPSGGSLLPIWLSALVDGRSRAFFVPLYRLGPASERVARPSCANILYVLVRTLVYLSIYSLRPSDQRISSRSFPC